MARKAEETKNLKTILIGSKQLNKLFEYNNSPANDNRPGTIPFARFDPITPNSSIISPLSSDHVDTIAGEPNFDELLPPRTNNHKL